MTILRAAAAGSVAVALSLTAVPGARAAAGPGGLAAPAVRGLDVSAYQHQGPPIDWPRISRLGFNFVGIKVSEGTYYRNPYYLSDARSAAGAGLAVLPYVFADPRRAGGRATASFAASVTGTRRGQAQLPFVVDLENDPYKKADNCYGRRVPVMLEWITGFIAEARQLTGQWPVIYTTDAWWRQCTGATTRFGRSPLWLAAFGAADPSVPAPWHQWAFWQYADNGAVPG
ncbi:MAG TPA: GH25 family lysozyme, partial [Trebonia sp.]